MGWPQTTDLQHLVLAVLAQICCHISYVAMLQSSSGVSSGQTEWGRRYQWRHQMRSWRWWWRHRGCLDSSISYGMESAVGWLSLDKRRERIHIWVRFLSSKHTYDVTSLCKSMSKGLAILLKYKGKSRLMVSGNRLLKEIESRDYTENNSKCAMRSPSIFPLHNWSYNTETTEMDCTYIQ